MQKNFFFHREGPFIVVTTHNKGDICLNSPFFAGAYAQEKTYLHSGPKKIYWNIQHSSKGFPMKNTDRKLPRK